MAPSYVGLCLRFLKITDYVRAFDELVCCHMNMTVALLESGEFDDYEMEVESNE